MVHLGHILTCNLMDNARCSRDFCKQTNAFLFRFGFCDPVVQTRLLLNYCMSLYGCALWSLNYSEKIKNLDVCLKSFTTVGYLLEVSLLGYGYLPWFIFSLLLGASTGTLSQTHSLWVHNIGHTYSLASIQ